MRIVISIPVVIEELQNVVFDTAFILASGIDENGTT